MAQITGTLSTLTANGTIHMGTKEQITEVETTTTISGSLNACNVKFCGNLTVIGSSRLHIVTIGGKLTANGPLDMLTSYAQEILCCHPQVYLTRSTTPSLTLRITPKAPSAPIKVFLQRNTHVGTVTFDLSHPNGELHVDVTSSVRKLVNGRLFAHIRSKL